MREALGSIPSVSIARFKAGRRVLPGGIIKGRAKQHIVWTMGFLSVLRRRLLAAEETAHQVSFGGAAAAFKLVDHMPSTSAVQESTRQARAGAQTRAPARRSSVALQVLPAVTILAHELLHERLRFNYTKQPTCALLAHNKFHRIKNAADVFCSDALENQHLFRRA